MHMYIKDLQSFAVFTYRYYIRESKGSPRWLLFLEGEHEQRYMKCRWQTACDLLYACSLGGWYCISKDTCDYRFQTMKTLMGSSSWSQTRRGRRANCPRAPQIWRGKEKKWEEMNVFQSPKNPDICPLFVLLHQSSCNHDNGIFNWINVSTLFHRKGNSVS